MPCLMFKFAAVKCITKIMHGFQYRVVPTDVVVPLDADIFRIIPVVCLETEAAGQSTSTVEFILTKRIS